VFAVIGEALIDMVQPEPGLMFEAQPGGGPLNIAVGLRRLGHETAFLGRVSTRPLGDLVRGHIEGNGLDIGTCVMTDDQTTLAFAALDEQGKASYDFYVQQTADWGWTDEELSALPDGCRAVHTGSLAGFLLPGADAILRLWQRCRARGERLLSLDPWREDAHRQLFSREHPLAVAMAQFDVSNGINPHVRRLIEFLDRRSHARHGRHLEQMLRNKRTEQAK